MRSGGGAASNDGRAESLADGRVVRSLRRICSFYARRRLLKRPQRLNRGARASSAAIHLLPRIRHVRLLPGAHAAVDEEHLAVDVAGRIAAEVDSAIPADVAVRDLPV